MGDGIEGADFLDFIAKKIEAIRLICGDRINVDNPAADRVVPWRFAYRFGIVVELSQLLQQSVERLDLPRS